MAAIEVNNLICQNIKHKNGEIVGFCIDEKCTEKNKFSCLECFFDQHSQHKMVKLDELNKILSKINLNNKKYLEENKNKVEKYTSAFLTQKQKIQEFKNKFISDIENKINDFQSNIEKQYKDLYFQGKNAIISKNLEKLEEFFGGNAAPILKIDLNNLSEIINNVYFNHCKETDGQLNNYNKNVENKVDNSKLEELSKKVSDFIHNLEQTSKTLFYNDNKPKQIKNTNKNFDFQWCNKTYDTYKFLYELSNYNKNGRKVLEDETMTILRAKDGLKNNCLYKFRFKIGRIYEGDFDVGIGTDNIGGTCWLRNSESICLSSSGVFNLGMNMDDSQLLQNNDIVDIEVDTKNKQFKGTINDKLICVLDYSLQDIYIMVAIRNNGNYIETLDANSTPL